MKTIRLLSSAAMFLAVCQGNLHAGSMSSSILDESLLTSPALESFCVGFNYDESKRGINNDNEKRTLETRVYSLYLGYDLSEWCTLFATIGQSEAKLSSQKKFGQGKEKWSIGINANLWQTEITKPPLFTGHISLRPAFEISRCNSQLDSSKTEWTDISAAIFICYAKVIDDPKYNPTEFYGYTIYVGPAFSMIDGTISGRTDFTEEKNIGLIAGLDFFITGNLSIGGQIQSFDKLSFSGNFRYHF